jgi:uncharacterized repeat protein (TIGR03803 family)
MSALAVLALAGPAQAKYKVLYSFCSLTDCSDGYGPNYGLVADAAGNLFGTTGSGGANGGGTVFELVKAGKHWTESVLYSFCSQTNCADGRSPLGPLIMDTSGNLYGVTTERGAHDSGNVFELAKGPHHTWSLAVLHSFCTVQQPTCADGSAFPSGLSYLGRESGAPYDGTSPLYGATSSGGDYGSGTVYSLTRGKHKSWLQTVLYSFCAAGLPCPDGAAPMSTLVVRDASTIFGTTVDGGTVDASQGGVAFKLVADGDKWDESTLYTFCSQPDCTDGFYPSGPLTLDASGSLLGMTVYGGADITRCKDGSDCGVIYKIAPDGSESTLYRFCALANCADGTGPEGGVAVDENGVLYGLTLGVDGPGTLFRFDGALEVLHTFCSKTNCADGDQPYNVTLIRDAAGNFFGTARDGGANGQGGVVLEWIP